MAENIVGRALVREDKKGTATLPSHVDENFARASFRI
jgi:hypothetical protein